MNEYYRRRDYDTGSKVRMNWFGIRPFWYGMALSLLVWIGMIYAVIELYNMYSALKLH